MDFSRAGLIDKTFGQCEASYEKGKQQGTDKGDGAEKDDEIIFGDDMFLRVNEAEASR